MFQFREKDSFLSVLWCSIMSKVHYEWNSHIIKVLCFLCFNKFNDFLLQSWKIFKISDFLWNSILVVTDVQLVEKMFSLFQHLSFCNIIWSQIFFLQKVGNKKRDNVNKKVSLIHIKDFQTFLPAILCKSFFFKVFLMEE